MPPTSNDLDRALYLALTDYGPLTELLATALSVFRDEAPPTASLPCVVFTRQQGRPLWHLGGRYAAEDTYVVKGITQGHSAVLAGSIDVQIDAAIGDQSLPIAGGAVLYCRRAEAVVYPEHAPGGLRFNHAGGIYRLWTA